MEPIWRDVPWILNGRISINVVRGRSASVKYKDISAGCTVTRVCYVEIVGGDLHIESSWTVDQSRRYLTAWGLAGKFSYKDIDDVIVVVGNILNGTLRRASIEALEVAGDAVVESEDSHRLRRDRGRVTAEAAGEQRYRRRYAQRLKCGGIGKTTHDGLSLSAAPENARLAVRIRQSAGFSCLAERYIGNRAKPGQRAVPLVWEKSAVGNFRLN